jgi:hypothetical protein
MVGGTSFHREILKASVGRLSKSKNNTKSNSNSNSNSKIKSSYEGKVKTGGSAAQ